MSSRPDSLRVFVDGEVVFSYDGRWLHPLFELETYLDDSGYEPERLLVVDTIVGKAAALMLVRMGIRSVRAGIMSRLAEGVFASAGVAFEAETVVDRIDCMTEQILQDIDDPDRAYLILAERAGRREA